MGAAAQCAVPVMVWRFLMPISLLTAFFIAFIIVLIWENSYHMECENVVKAAVVSRWRRENEKSIADRCG